MGRTGHWCSHAGRGRHRGGLVIPLASIATLLLTVTGAHAAAIHGPCRGAIVALYPGDAVFLESADAAADTDSDNCVTLADRIWNTVRTANGETAANQLLDTAQNAATLTAARELVRSEDVSPVGNTSAGTQGTIAQIRGVAPIQPCPEAGATVAMSATAAGPQPVVGVCANPLAVAKENDAERFSRFSRLWDMSVVVPLSASALRSGAQPVESVTFQTRLDVTGWFTPIYETVVRGYGERLQQAQNAIQGADQSTSHRYADVLAASADKTACARSLLSGRDQAVQRACGIPRPNRQAYDSAKVAMRSAIADLRATSDALNAGMDLRVDIGRAVGSPMDRFDAGVVTAGAVGDYRLINSTFKLVVRGRLGVKYGYEPQLPFRLGGDVAAGADLGIILNGRLLLATSGVEGVGYLVEASPGRTDFARTSYLNVRLGAEVPLLAGGSVAVGVTYPVVFAGPQRTPIFTVSGDWLKLLTEGLSL